MVAAQDSEVRVDAAVTRGTKLLKKQMRADEKDLENASDEATSNLIKTATPLKQRIDQAQVQVNLALVA